MVAHRIDTVVDKDGRLIVPGLPFRPGQRVEVIVLLHNEPARAGATRYPLRGRPYRLDDPLSPVGLKDWEVIN